MSKVAVVFPDAMLSILNILRAAFPEIRFGTITPEEMRDAPVPYVMVRTDGSSTRYPIVETTTIRVSVWHATEAQGIALAQRLLAILLVHSGDEAVRSVSMLTGAFPTSDPDTGSPLSSFTIAARLRPVPLSLGPSPTDLLMPGQTTYPGTYIFTAAAPTTGLYIYPGADTWSYA